jgi:hypothetical protein
MGATVVLLSSVSLAVELSSINNKQTTHFGSMNRISRFITRAPRLVRRREKTFSFFVFGEGFGVSAADSGRERAAAHAHPRGGGQRTARGGAEGTLSIDIRAHFCRKFGGEEVEGVCACVYVFYVCVCV